MDVVKDSRKLEGKTNFVSWKREFERAARTNDIFEYLTGEEMVPSKPRKEDYFEKPVGIDTRRLTRAMSAQAQTTTPSTEGDADIYDTQAMVSTNDSLRWQIELKEYEKAKEKMKLAGKLLDSWVCEGIKIEIEEFADAKKAYDFIKRRYAVTHERARDDLLNVLHELKLDACSSMTEYTNKVRQVKADLKTVKYHMTDDMLATVLLHGLPPNYRDFKEKYDWIRSTKPDDSPDLDYLFERLHVEETKQTRQSEERKAKDRARKAASSHSGNPNGGTGYNSSRRPKREDKSHLKCTYPGCGKTGHTEETCWTKEPSKAPRSVKDRIAANTDKNPVDGMGGTTETNLTTFRDAYSVADDLGAAPFPALHANVADTSPQMRNVGPGREVQRSGGASAGVLEFRKSSLTKQTLGAFLVGTSCTPDTWLADTGANMHIVNDTKWFKQETFRPFRDCSIDISTADGSTTLEVKGGGDVQVVLRNPDGIPRRVSLSDVAYAPQRKCNLFSGGMFAQKAKLTGVYNDQYMTWINDQGHKIGHAIFENGLYHLNAEKALSPFESGEVVAATVNFDDPVWKWHRRLGHLGFQNMLKLLHSATGMEITAAQIKAKPVIGMVWSVLVLVWSGPPRLSLVWQFLETMVGPSSTINRLS
ncbi:gag-polypeptide of LTR copia-type domain-containing protein [Pochonia chlamydosporia 170]|uniref:Gag-polypeptide of LTR copia-type domain-containing protein n=1 Tax=Pochonia chlamydosporia 170 TaxID=1380566 RepID=A0A179EWZ5_METCM|nr:gag-polypeptide of LTR copia-type domain-containing protein [Pochonia chlamydosporia 170]OAQ57707.1 gag-polypeptide of LTR copia-type domain-containing protein [Pochonia chlamydosporia 170]